MRKTKRKTRKLFRKSKKFEHGMITEFDETYDGVPFFRKVFWYPEKPKIKDEIDISQLAYNEQAIIKILMKNPHPNIVSFYHINKKYLDMELLDTENIDIEKAKIQMKKAKKFLHGLGIIYMDWKPDNIGKDKYGNYKLFDFDASGLINTKGWKIKPVELFAFRAAKIHSKHPIEMDDWVFNEYFN
jgi:serine/threonine protein kinase